MHFGLVFPCQDLAPTVSILREIKLCHQRYHAIIFEMVLHTDCTRQLWLGRSRQSRLAANQGGDRLLSQANCSAIFLAANALPDAFSIRLTGLQDTSPQLLLGKVTDMCRVLAKCELPAWVAGQQPTRSPASLGTLLSAPGAESRARQAGSSSPHVGTGYVCVTGQIISSFADSKIIMKMTSAAVNYRMKLSNPKPNTGVGRAPHGAGLPQPFYAGTGDHDGVKSISLPQGVQANTTTSGTVRGAQTIHPAMW